jgi:hypothetical protein
MCGRAQPSPSPIESKRRLPSSLPALVSIAASAPAAIALGREEHAIVAASLDHFAEVELDDDASALELRRPKSSNQSSGLSMH